MKNLKVNTDNISRFKIKNEPVENVLIYGNKINRFGIFYDYCSYGNTMNCMEDGNRKNSKRHYWLLDQIHKYKANVYIICNQKTIDYYKHLLDWYVSWYNVDISNVKLLKEDEKYDILEKFGTL